MAQLLEKYRKKISQIPISFVRSLMQEINWDSRLIIIKGARGVGKTTLLLQYIKLYLSSELNSTLYISLDNLWFAENKLTDLVDDFVKQGGKYLFIDEVHKYPQWSLVIKNIYDDYPELKLVVAGSSLLEILNARADLSRRAIVYSMPGLSFREFLNMQLELNFKYYSLKDLLKNYEEISKDISLKIKPFQYFYDYLKFGYYPFFKEQLELFYIRLEEIVNMILEIELPQQRRVNIAYINKIKQLLQIIAQSAPFIPNISKLSTHIGINRETLLTYLFYLNEANLINSAYKDSFGITFLKKPEKLYLENTNLMYALCENNIIIGNARETFFFNQIKNKYTIELSKSTDFIVEKYYSFEIGGKSKSNIQIKDLENAFIVADDIEYGFNNRIPLWLFGFLY